MSEVYLTVDEVATYIRLSPHTIRKLVHRRKIPFAKPNRRILFAKSAIDGWMLRHEVKEEV